MSELSPDEAREAALWLKEAKEELAVAERIAGDDDLPRRIVCFHAHLAAEKAIKSLQIRRGVVVRRIHNLSELAAGLPDEDFRRFDREDLRMLNPWTIDGRYPADHDDGSHETAGAVLEAARRVVDAVKDGW
jgi:HEPN domain-containing protein